MRRKDREVRDITEILAVISRCKVCRLGFQDDGGVYIVPLNFGYTYDGGTLTFYFHSAREGHKLDLLKRGGKVGFELDTGHELIEANQACSYGYRFESVIGTGYAALLTDERAKAHALEQLMCHQTGRAFSFTPEMTRTVTVFSLTADTVTCKRHE